MLASLTRGVDHNAFGFNRKKERNGETRSRAHWEMKWLADEKGVRRGGAEYAVTGLDVPVITDQNKFHTSLELHGGLHRGGICET
jgi:hypothetical protein